MKQYDQSVSKSSLEERTYQHSGQSSTSGLVLALAIGIVLSLGLAFVYNLMIVIIPFVYINFFITLGFSMIVGYSAKFLSRLGKIRNQNQNLVLAGVIGFVAFYAQWIAYISFLITEQYSFHAYLNNFHLFHNPGAVISFLVELSKVGSWQVFGVVFKDFALWIIWIIEAGMILAIPVLIIKKHPILPFSETHHKWYSVYKLKFQFQRISTQLQFVKDLLEDAVSTINSLTYGEAHRFSEVSIYYLDGEDHHYLSVDNVLIEDRGKGSTERTNVIHLIRINTETAQKLMQQYGSKKQFLLDY